MSIFKVAPKREKQIKFYVSEAERKELKKVAKKLDMSVSDLIRDALDKYIAQQKKNKKI